MLRHKHLHKKKQKAAFDYLVYFFTIATPLFELPQAYTIFTTHNAESVSLWTWAFFFVASIVWAIYGVREKLLPITVTSILYMVIEAAVVVGILMYR